MSPEPSIVSTKNAGVARQLLVLLLISTSTVNIGMMQGWLSPMTDHLKSADSPVGTLANIEIGYLASAPGFMTFPSSILFGYIANTFGRKVGVFLAGIPTLAAGLLVTFARTKTMLYVGRALLGVGGVMISLGPMYLSETVHESIRGTLISSISISLYVGILVSYTLGKYLTYRQFNFIMVALPSIHLCTTIFLPETPYYLVSKSRAGDALKSLMWLRGGKIEVANTELKRIHVPQVKNVGFLRTLKKREARMALMISVGLMTLQTLSGIHITLNYASMIFAETGSPLGTDGSATLSALTLLVSTFVCIGLIDRVGRKPILYFSFVFGFICHLVLSVSLFLHYNGYAVMHLDWISITCIVTFIFTYGIGLGVGPAVISNEVSPVEIKPYISAVTTIAAVVTLVSLLQSFPIIFESVGMHWNFVIPTVANFLGMLFTRFVVPETKGKTLSDISNYLKGSSRRRGR